MSSGWQLSKAEYVVAQSRCSQPFGPTAPGAMGCYDADLTLDGQGDLLDAAELQTVFEEAVAP